MLTEGTIVNTQQDFCIQQRVTSELTKKLFGLSFEQSVWQAHRHTVAAQKWLSSRAPQGARYEGKGITATSTGIREGLLNLAHDAQFPDETPSETVDAEIEAIKAFFAGRCVSFMWWLSPMANPADMSERLPKHGMVLLDYRLPTLMAPLPDNLQNPPYDPAIEVWQANSIDDLKAASHVRHTAFNFPKDAALTYFEDMAEDWLRGDPAKLFLARVGNDSPPVAIGALVMGNGIPGVYVMATLPEWEGRGLGKAILTRILGSAKAEGHDRIALTAGARAYSLYRKFGFEHLFEYELYGLP